MTDNDREQIALFRFSLISPILNGQVEKQSEYLAEVAAKKHNVPYYGVREYSPKTIAMWVRDYRKNGFNGLKPKTRNDKGKSRILTPELKKVILEARIDHLDRSVSLLYDQPITEKKMLPSQASYSTVYRFLKRRICWSTLPAEKKKDAILPMPRSICYGRDMRCMGLILILMIKKLKFVLIQKHMNIFIFMKMAAVLLPLLVNLEAVKLLP